MGDSFIEVHVHCDLELCEARDPKGLYKKACAGEINDFTGISAPYQAPEHPEIAVDTGDAEFGDIGLLGFGVRHSISQYMENAPVSLAASVFYQKLKVGDAVQLQTQ